MQADGSHLRRRQLPGRQPRGDRGEQQPGEEGVEAQQRGLRLAADLRGDVYGRLMTLSPAYFSQLRTGEAVSRLTADITLIETFFGSTFSMAVRSTVTSLGALALISTVFWIAEPARFAPPWFHVMSGAAVFGAFFIATDPVSASTTAKGRLVYGVLIGVLVYVIRRFGGYPDAFAFAVLLANLCVPLIDNLTRPKVYGARRK